MATVPAKITERIAAGIKRFQPILESAKSRDVGESDTVIIIIDMLTEIFGYDKFSEVTSEYSIKCTWCDLATKIDGKLQMLIEVKAIGIELKDNHVKQAVDYAANQGIDWVILTNGLIWRAYKMVFSKPIDAELVVTIDFGKLSPKNPKDIESLYLFAKEGWLKSELSRFDEEREAHSRFFVGAVIVSEPVLELIRREIRRLSPNVKIDIDAMRSVLLADVLKRDVIEGEKADAAKKKVAKVAAALLKAKNEKKETAEDPPEIDVAATAEAGNGISGGAGSIA